MVVVQFGENPSLALRVSMRIPTRSASEEIPRAKVYHYETNDIFAGTYPRPYTSSIVKQILLTGIGNV